MTKAKRIIFTGLFFGIFAAGPALAERKKGWVHYLDKNNFSFDVPSQYKIKSDDPLTVRVFPPTDECSTSLDFFVETKPMGVTFEKWARQRMSSNESSVGVWNNVKPVNVGRLKGFRGHYEGDLIFENYLVQVGANVLDIRYPDAGADTACSRTYEGIIQSVQLTQ